jgi:hypothetical protein
MFHSDRLPGGLNGKIKSDSNTDVLLSTRNFPILLPVAEFRIFATLKQIVKAFPTVYLV